MNRDFFRGKRVLVTGGVGFIGSNLAIRLFELGADVTVVDSMLPEYGARLDNLDPFRSSIKLNFNDLRDAHTLSELIRDTEIIFSLSGQVSHSESMRDPHKDLSINCASQLTLLECCRKENSKVRIIFTSTRQIYGRPLKIPVTEDHPKEPVDVNGINKLAAEKYFNLYWKVYGMETVCLRLTNTYGPRMDLTTDNKGVIGIFIRNGLQGVPIQLYGDGTQVRDFNYVDDVVDALLYAAFNSSVVGQSFNLGHDQCLSLLEVVEFLNKYTGVSYTSVPWPNGAKIIDIGSYSGDYSKFHSITGWSPKILFETGLKTTLDWFRKHRDGNF